MNQSVGHDLAGLALIVIANVCTVFALSLIAYERSRTSTWRPQFTLEWLLALFLVVNDASLYFLLGFTVLLDDDPLALWEFCLILLWGTIAFLLFLVWSKDHVSREAHHGRA